MNNTQDNLSEYSDPRMYDSENYDFEPDGPFILDLAKQLEGSVLELGCGTGRLTIPLAQHGVNITGLDVVPGMIEFAKQKSGDMPINWIEADVRDFHLGRKFSLIFEAGSVFHHMLTRQDQEAYLARVREHLEDDGRLEVNILFPKSKYLVSGSEEEEWFTTQHPDGYEVRVSGIDIYDDLRQVKTETAYRRWQDANGKEMQLVAPLSLRYVFPQEMEALIYYNGFEIVDRYGDFDKQPVTNESRQIIYVFRKRANFTTQ
ncbi:MAG: class I SAM-dependent methyltransferase [Chloroflexi bacterium]|nr:class I SAM-dependent methyltransferase [Chloroflexota bacterium]MDL1941586.1 class I SAM-dependent methyltransferase [Chloroflexi bacterium CFX2]